MGEALLKGVDVGLENQTVDLEKITLVRGFCDLLMSESTGEQRENRGDRGGKYSLANSGRDR